MTDKAVPECHRYGLSQERWSRMSIEDRVLQRRIRPLRGSVYRVDYPLSRVEDMIEQMADTSRVLKGTFELNPDFQRGHVWPRSNQIAYMESLFRGLADTNLRFNCPGWSNVRDELKGDIHAGDVVCVDGLQRLTAIREFMAGEFKVFDGLGLEELAGTSFDPKRLTMKFSVEVFDIGNRADLLQFYLDINSGGIVHTDEELDRVRGLLSSAVPPVAATASRRPAKRGR